jgi:hypothetical protein
MRKIELRQDCTVINQISLLVINLTQKCNRFNKTVTDPINNNGVLYELEKKYVTNSLVG